MSEVVTAGVRAVTRISGEDYIGGDNTRQGILPLKYPYSSFSWTTV